MKKTLFLVLVMLLPYNVFASNIDKTTTQSNTDKKDIQQTLKIEKIPSMSVDLKTPPNLYLLLLPFITIAIVVGSTVITIKTLNNKTAEAKASFTESLNTQREISEYETKAKILSASRQDWINTLRNELAELISILHLVEIEVTINKNKPVSESFGKLISQSELKAAKINLLINPEEDDHKELAILIKKALSETGKGFKGISEVNEKIVALSQKILKDEWNVLKGFK